MYEIFNNDTRRTVGKEWMEIDAHDLANDFRKASHMDIIVRYVRHHAPDFVALFDEMEEGQTIDLYREGHRQPSLTVKRTGDEWSIEINGLSVPFAGAYAPSWNEDVLMLVRGDRTVAEVERVDELELEKF